MKKAIFPGSFDPIHEGHKKILEKGLKLFDFVYVVVADNFEKPNQSSHDKRFEDVKQFLKDFNNIEIISLKNKLLADLSRELDVFFLIRSGRKNLDFDYELELAHANRFLNKDLETVILIPELADIDFESRLIKQGVKK